MAAELCGFAEISQVVLHLAQRCLAHRKEMAAAVVQLPRHGGDLMLENDRQANDIAFNAAQACKRVQHLAAQLLVAHIFFWSLFMPGGHSQLFTLVFL